MKIKQEHYSAIKEGLDRHKEKIKNFREHYEKNHNLTRYMWDFFQLALRDSKPSLLRKLHSYCNDDHIHTALKKYFKNNNLIF